MQKTNDVKNGPTVEEFLSNLRANVVLTQSNAEHSALTAFDKVVEQLQVFANTINSKNLEIKRLEDLCKTNKIEYTQKEENKPSEITPVIKK